MKKNPLLLTLAVSALAPNAMAQVDATSKIANPGFEEGEVNWDVEGFTVTDKATEGGLVVDAKFLKLTPAQAGAKLNGLVTQKIVGLPEGKYNLKVEVAVGSDDAANDEKHYMVAGADITKLIKVTEISEVAVGDDGVLVIGYEAKDVDATFIGIDNFKLEVSKTVIDPIKEALTHNLAVAIAKANSIKDEKISAILVKASEISDRIVKFNFADYQDFVENREESKLFTEIEALENDLVAAVENKVQYDRAKAAYAMVSLKDLNDNYAKVIAEGSTYSAEYKDAAKVVYDAAMAAHKAFGDNIESSYTSGAAATDFSDENIKSKIELLEKTISDAADAIGSGNTNDVAYAFVSGEVNKAKQYFIDQSDILYANLSGSYQAVYGDWFAKASVELRNIYKDVLNVEAENITSREEKKCEANKAGYIKRLVDAKAAMADVVEEYVTKAKAQKEVYAEYAGYVTGLETSLNKEMAQTKEEAFKEDEAAIQTAIDALLATLNDADKAHDIDDEYKAEFKKDTTAIGENIAKLGKYIDWDNLYLADKAKIAEIEQALVDKKNSVAELKQGDYSAADMYPGTVKAIQDSIAKWTIAYEIRKEYTPYVFNPTTGSVGKDIEKYSTDAKTTFEAYKVASDKLAKYKTEVDSLKKKATDGSVTIDGTIDAQAKTYKAYIADCENVIKAAEDSIAKALTKYDAEHIKAVNNLKTDFDVDDVKSKTANYDDCSEDWNANMDNAAWLRIKSECTACVTAVTSVLPKEKYDDKTYGLKTDDLNQKRSAILEEIAAINGMIVETDKKVESKEMSVAEALSLLTTVLKDAEAVKAKADALDAEAKAAAKKVVDEDKAKADVDTKITKSLEEQLNGNNETDETKKIVSVIDLNEDKTDKIAEYFTDSVAKLNAKIETLKTAVDESRKKETLVSDCQKIEEKVEGEVVYKKGYNEQITDLATEIGALRKKAEGTTANLKAKNAMVAHYTTEVKVGDNIGVDAILKQTQDDVDGVYSTLVGDYDWTNSQGHYNEVIVGLKTKFGKIKESINKVYVDQNAVAKKDSLIKEINDVVTEATGLKAKVEANEAAYKAQLDSVAVVETKWKEAYDYIIEKAELGNTLQQSLDTLAAVQLELKKGREVIEDSHSKGEGAAKTVSLLSAFGKCSTKIDAVKNGWGDAYKAEVAAYNQKTKDAFDDQYNALSKAYADAVQYIDKMNKTEWAVAEDVNTVLKAITEGENGLYSYAAKIRDLKAEAQTAYDKAVAPIVFEEGEGLINKAKEMQAIVEGKFAQYESTLNQHAKNACEKEFTNASNALKNAMNEVARDLFGLAEDKYPSNGAFTSIKADLDKALVDSASSTFALKYEEVMKTINGIEARIPGAKEDDAKTYFNDQLNTLKALSLDEAEDIKQFHGKDGKQGAFNEVYADYVKNSLTAAQSRYDKLTEYYNEMTKAMTDDQSEETLKTLLAKFDLDDPNTNEENDPRIFTDKDGNPFEVFHSAKYWEAYDENDAWNVNDESYVYMNLQVDTVIGKLDTLNMFRLPLVATNAVQGTIDEHAKDIAAVQATIEEAHKAVTSKDVMAGVDAELKAIASRIKDSYASVLDKENSAIQSQLVTLRFEYSLAEAVEIDSIDVENNFKKDIDAYEAEANLIYSDFNTGTVDKDGKPVKDADGKNVCISADSAQVAYLNLEEKIGVTRKALAEIYNETLYKQIYDDLFVGVDSVQAQIDEQALFNDCHSSVKAKFEDEVKALNETLAGIVAAINARDKANTLMVYAENLTANIEEVAKNIAALAKDIAAEEAKYDVHDKNYKRLNDELDKFAAEVEKLSTTLHSYEYLTYESDYAEAQLDAINAGLIKLSDSIAYDRDVLVKINNAVDVDNNKTTFLTGESTNSCNDTKNETNTKWFENTVNDMLITYSYNNAVAVLANRDALRYNATVVFEGGRSYTEEDSKMLLATHSEIWTALRNISDYLFAAKNSRPVSNDINGNKIYDEDGNPTEKKVEFMDAYAEVMAAIEVLTPKLNEWVKNVKDLKYELGDVDHKGGVNVNDYIIVRNMVLGIITKETEGISSAAFYAADVTGDGKIDITDLTRVADNIMTGKSFDSYAARSLATANQNNSDAISAVVNGTGRHQQLVISLNNEMNYVGAQMDIVLPAGVKVVGESLADRAASHELFSNDVNGAHRVVISDINNNEFQNNEQALLVIDLEVSADFEGGALEINDAIFTTANGRGYALKAAIGGGETGITNLTVTEKAASRVYSIGGQMMNTLRKGINIIVNSDGTAKKVVNK